MAGRAWTASLFPLTSAEIPEFDLIKYLNRGGLPQVITSDYPDEELKSYVGTYLREEIRAQSELFGVAFEHFIMLEIRAYVSYRRLDIPVSYWRSTSKFEVDLIIGSSYALEIKSTALVTDSASEGTSSLCSRAAGTPVSRSLSGSQDKRWYLDSPFPKISRTSMAGSVSITSLR